MIVYAAPQAGGYKVIKRMQIGGDGGWDYMLMDPPSHRLYVARGSHFQVVDVTTGKVIGDIADCQFQELSRHRSGHGFGQRVHEQRRRQHGVGGGFENVEGDCP